ncbi:MAG: hypothetical protein OEY03_16135 [Rhizobacter sp.]|nr:hypothetical protein [Rhizobacter sp.]
MPTHHIHITSRPRTIDITPGASWRRSARALFAGLALVLVLPLLWLVGALALLGLLGGATIAAAAWATRNWWRGRGRARPSLDVWEATPHR